MQGRASTISSKELRWIARLADLRVSDATLRIERLQRKVLDRDDADGIRLLLRTMSLLTTQTGSLIDERVHEATRHRGSRKESVGVARSAVVQLEQILGKGFEALIAPPETDFVALVQPFIRLARAVTANPGTELIFECTEGFNYTTWPNVFEDIESGVDLLAPGLQETVAALPPLGLITYPARADSDTLMHSVIAHEVAHLALRSPVHVKTVSDAFEKVPMPRNGSQEVQRLYSWMQELLCDMLAVRMIGPAFFFGLLEYLLPTHDPDDPWGADVRPNLPDEGDSETHPPPVWRLRRLMRTEVAPFFKLRDDAYVGRAHRVYERCRSLVPRSPEPTAGSPEAADRAFLEEVLLKLRPKLNTVAGKAVYPHGRFRRDIPLVWQKLEDEISPAERIRGRRSSTAGGPAEDEVPRSDDDLEESPPATQWSEPIDWRSIMNGGYLRYLEQMLTTSPSGDDGLAELRTRTNAMLRGSIELSELHRRMITLSEQFDGLGAPLASVSKEIA